MHGDIALPPFGAHTHPATPDTTASTEQLSVEKLKEKSRKWRQLTQQRFGEKRKFASAETQKPAMPPEHLRKVM